MNFKSLKNAIYHFFYHPQKEQEISLVFFRIAIGIFCLIHFISIWSDFEILFGKGSIIPWDIKSLLLSTNFITLSEICDFCETCLSISISQTLLIFKISFVILCTFIVFGFFTRISALLLLILQLSYIKEGIGFVYGVDNFTSMSLTYLVLFPNNNKLSLQHFFTRGKKISKQAYLRVFQLHVSMLYFFSGFDKVLGFNWRNGEAIWKAIHLPHFNHDFQFNFSWLADYPWLVVATGWTAVIIEIAYPLFIWLSFSRKAWLLLTITLHLGIALVFNLYFFSTMMLIWNLTAFMHIFNKKQHSQQKIKPS